MVFVFSLPIYLPYGKDWYGYSTRRIKEIPGIASHVGSLIFC